jgi:hypothetical protein
MVNIFQKGLIAIKETKRKNIVNKFLSQHSNKKNDKKRPEFFFRVGGVFLNGGIKDKTLPGFSFTIGKGLEQHKFFLNLEKSYSSFDDGKNIDSIALDFGALVLSKNINKTFWEISLQGGLQKNSFLDSSDKSFDQVALRFFVNSGVSFEFSHKKRIGMNYGLGKLASLKERGQNDIFTSEKLKHQFALFYHNTL